MALTVEQMETATRLSWETGILRHMLKAPQHEPYDLFYTPKLSRRDVWVAGRRCRKSALLLTIHTETNIRENGVQTCYVAPVEKGIADYIKPIIEIVFRTCPDDLLPTYNEKHNHLLFPNESRIIFNGCNMRQYRYMRGQKNKLATVDEMAEVDDLESAVDDVLFPSVWDSHGRMVLSGTPPPVPSPDNPVMRYVETAKSSKAYWHASVYEAGYTFIEIAEALRETSKGAIGEKESYEIVQLCDPRNSFSIPTIYDQAERIGVSREALTVFLREFMAEFIRDENAVIVPEFVDKDHVLKTAYVPPVYYDMLYKATGSDLGVADKTVQLFGVADYPRAKIVIQKEFWLQGADVRTDIFASRHNDALSDLGWRNKKRESHWSDNSNPMLLNDLLALHGISINATDKEDKAQWLNLVRILFKDGSIEIDPSCELLIATLNGAFWKDPLKKDYGRTHALGHMDALDALVYLIRNLNRSANPFPLNYSVTLGVIHDAATTIYPEGWNKGPRTQEGQVLAKIFNKGRFRSKPSEPPTMGGL